VTKKQLNKIIKMSPVPVKLWSAMYIGRLRGRADGFFDREKQYIVCTKEYSTITKAAIILHEMGHEHCAHNNCECWDNSIRCEVHAQIFALKKSIELKNYEVLKRGITMVKEWGNFGELYIVYKMASKVIMQKPIWKRCKKLLEEKK
jgi:hypothetical protein